MREDAETMIVPGCQVIQGKLVRIEKRGTSLHGNVMRVGRISLVAVLSTVAFSVPVVGQGVEDPDKAQAAAPAPRAASIDRESLAGSYDGGQMEVAAQLVLKPNGDFEYELAYGALDEASTGTWEFKDGAVYLTTVPAVVAPRFVVESDKPAPNGELWIKLSSGPVMEGARQRVYLIYGPKDPPEMVEIADDGRVPLPGGRQPTAILPEIPVYPITGKPIPLAGAGGHRLVMRFEPNDIGKADFRAQRLGIEGGVLVLPRRDLQIVLRFKRLQ